MRARSGALVLIVLLLLSGCGVERDVIKIGLVAPFEGRYREIGYDVIPAARQAIREWAAHGEGPIIELVSYDDMGDADLAREQARKLLADPEVAVVIGHWRTVTTQAAAPLYAEAGLPLIAFDGSEVPGALNLSASEGAMLNRGGEWASQQRTPTVLIPAEGDVTDLVAQVQETRSQLPQGQIVGSPGFGLNQFMALAVEYGEGVYFVNGAPLPGDEDPITEGELFALPAYLATWLAIEQIVGEEVQTPADSLTFDQNGRRMDAPIYLYQWHDGSRVLVNQLQ